MKDTELDANEEVSLSSPAAYEVGFRKPPKHTQFKKGVSGNSSGRPKAKPSFASQLDEALDETTAVTINGRRRKLSFREIGAKKMAAQIAQGDHRARAHLIEIERIRGRLAPGEAELGTMDADDEAILESFLRQYKTPEAADE